jgi:hypothetical protein
MVTSRRIAYFAPGVAVSMSLCLAGIALADSPGAETTASEAERQAPHESFFSSLAQAFKQDFDHAVVRGHFDVGSAPDTHRYYCLVDPKTGKTQPSGVAGQPVPRPDGMTGIKATAVSLYSCASAEAQGNLVTAGYTLSAGAARMIVPAEPAPKQASGAPLPGVSRDKIDVAGVKLGMSPDEVRAVLKAKKLSGYSESMETLGHGESTKSSSPPANVRFVNVISAWTASPAGEAVLEDGEAYEVMFTPVPGKERAMAIVHSTGYAPGNAVRETALDSGLARKYGGFSGAGDLPASPTWRIQANGNVEVGDACNRRGIFGGLSGLNVGNTARPNLALKTTLEEFQFQIDHCGVAIVTEDHSTANTGAAREERVIARFTVTAYSPSIGLDGATTAAQMIQRAGDPLNKASSPRTKDQTAPNL